MKRFNNGLLLLLALVTLHITTSCQDDKKTLSSAERLPELAKDTVRSVDTLSTETKLLVESEVVLECAKSIFREVKNYQLSCGGIVMNELFDKMYCSTSWNDMLMSVRRKEFETNTLFFEVDYWAMTRELGFVTFDEFRVSKLVVNEDEKFASVDFTVYDLFTYNPARVDMVYENGRWVINNFYDLKYGVNVRNSMMEYLVTDLI